MAAIRERVRGDGTRVFNVQVRMVGYPARSASFRNRRDAERWAKLTEGQMIEGRHFRNAEARRRTVAEAIDRYLETEPAKKRDADGPRTRLAWWKVEIGGVKLADVSPALLVEKRDKLASGKYQRAKPSGKRSKFKDREPRQYERSAATVNRYLASIGHVFTIARREWHWLSHNPMDGVSKLREARGRVRALSDVERKALLAETAKDSTLHLFVLVALSTACRAGELLNLAWPDVDLKAGRLLFRVTKNTQPRTAWVSGAALELLKAHGKVRPISGEQRVFASPSGGVYEYAKAFRAAVAAAGIHDMRFHDLRHTAATYLAQQGATEQQLRAIGGWKSSVVSRYVHLAAADAKGALEKLAEKLGQ
jgi:integrase